MQQIQIDRKKSADIDDWAQDRSPGDRVCLYGTIKAIDPQTLTVTVEEIEEDDREEDKEKTEGGNMGSDAEPATSPPGTLGAMDDEGPPV